MMLFLMFRFGKNLKVLWYNLLVNGIGEGLPGDPVVKNPPCNVGDAGSTLGWGTKSPHAMEQLISPQPESPCVPRKHPTWQQRSCRHAATKTQHRQIDKYLKIKGLGKIVSLLHDCWEEKNSLKETEKLASTCNSTYAFTLWLSITILGFIPKAHRQNKQTNKTKQNKKQKKIMQKAVNCTVGVL